jgi:hypothetical protein
MSAATAQLLGFVVLGLVLLLAATKLAADQLTARRNHKNEAGTKKRKSEGAVRKRLRLWHPKFRHPRRSAKPRRWRATPQPGSQISASGQISAGSQVSGGNQHGRP